MTVGDCQVDNVDIKCKKKYVFVRVGMSTGYKIGHQTWMH